jgi:hypothetical protein
MAKVAPTSYPLDELKAAKHIMLNSKKLGNNEMLVTYIKHEVMPRLEAAGIIEYEKTFDGIISAIDKHIEENIEKSKEITFYDEPAIKPTSL